MAGVVGVRLPELVPAVLLRRYKRFLADVRLPDGSACVAHMPNPGRMTSCLADGETPCRLSDAGEGRRKLRYTVELTRVGDTWVLVNTQRPNAIVGEALREGRIAELAGYPTIEAERATGTGSRIDWRLSDGDRVAWVEVKNATLVRDGVAAFPDAVTSRGARHLAELEARVAAGDRAVLLFHVGRGDAVAVTAADDVDPAYGSALRRAADRGVELYAWRAEITEHSATLVTRLPVRL